MKQQVVSLLSKQFFKETVGNKGLFALLFIYLAVLGYTTVDSWIAFQKQQHVVLHHQQESRKSWDDNPDKHPHRMAHFGSFVFRLQHPLSIFDAGIQSYTGNSIYLEAHKQNTANFSEASLSTGLVRFGNLSVAMLLQLILPLIIFFLGYAAITAEKEKGTLKIIHIQGATLKEILWGKSAGLFLVSLLFYVPSMIALWSISLLESNAINSAVIIRSLLITWCYLVFYIILCIGTVVVSGKSANSNKSLLTLLGAWLLFFIIIPKTAQAVGGSLYPNLSKVAFNAAIEAEIIKTGDSHNPNDPYFNKLRDSILVANKVDKVEDLPFNYSGFLMSRGEAQSAGIYKKQHQKLIDTYRKQNSITQALVLLNPYLAIKNISMSLSGTDFDTYVNFLAQTEAYRYEQSQYMNALQIKFISNKAKTSEGKVNVVGKEYWQSLDAFQYKYMPVSKTIQKQLLALAALFVWLVLSLVGISRYAHRFKIL